MTDDVYRRLQKHIDDLPIAYPATPSGVEISILKRLFTPEEAEVALSLSAVPEPVEKIHRRVPGHAEQELEHVAPALEGGAVVRRTEGH